MGKKEEAKARQESEYQYYKQGITEPREIKKKLEKLGIEVNIETVRRDLKKLEEEGKIIIVTQEAKTKKRKEIVKELYGNQGLTREKLRKETNKELERTFGIPISFSLTVIEKDVKELKDNKEVTEDAKEKRMEEEKQERIEENLRTTRILVKQRKTIDQIAEIMGKNRDTIKSYKAKLREQDRLTGKEQPRRKATIEKEARMEKVDGFNKEEMTELQMAEELGVSRTTIARDKKRIIERIEIRKEIVKIGVILEKNEEQIQAEIKEKLNLEVSIETIHSDILYLKSEGEIEKPENEKLIIPRRREIVKIMYNNEKSRKEIFERLQELGFNVTLKIVDSDIKALKKEGQITAKSTKELKEEKIQRRREIVKREYNTIEGGKRKTREEIQEIVQQEMNMKISLQIIDQDISYWRERGQLINKQKTKQEKRREIVKNSVINQKTEQQIQQEIQEKMKIEVSLERISDDINYLEIEGEIEPKDENILIRKRREVELYKQDATVEEIQETIKKEFNVKVSLAVIYRDIRPYIKLEKEEKLAIKMSHKELRKVAQKTCEEFYGQANLIMILKRYISSCKIRFQNNVLKAEDLPIIKESVMLMQNYENLAFYLKVAVSEEKFEEALDVINGQIGNEVFTKQEEKAIKSLQEKVKVLVKNNRAKQMLEKGFSVEETVKSTGVLETKVMEINRKLIEEKRNRQRELEENDDGDEQELA